MSNFPYMEWNVLVLFAVDQRLKMIKAKYDFVKAITRCIKQARSLLARSLYLLQCVCCRHCDFLNEDWQNGISWRSENIYIVLTDALYFPLIHYRFGIMDYKGWVLLPGIQWPLPFSSSLPLLPYPYFFRFYTRWKEWESWYSQSFGLHFSLREEQWQEDWAFILSLASQVRGILHKLAVWKGMLIFLKRNF